MTQSKKMKIGFVVGIFPALSETFIIDQVADLADHGVDVETFSFHTSDHHNISKRFFDYKMADRTHYLAIPANRWRRLLGAIPRALRILFYNGPRALMRALDVKKYGTAARSLRLLYWAAPFAGRKFDLYHCHFGVAADDFLTIRDILGIKTKFLTTFYGFDVSRIPQTHGVQVYDRLKQESSLFFVMSQNMRDRVVALGFDSKKVIVHPVSIDVEQYPFAERTLQPTQPVQIASVGRFVEKKGFDDLLRALAIAKEKTTRSFQCNIVGGGQLEEDLYKLTNDLGIKDVVNYKGYMKIEDVIEFFKDQHFFVQPSKTAKNGDME